MTSVDSGVDTGNDSNDSVQAEARFNIQRVNQFNHEISELRSMSDSQEENDAKRDDIARAIACLPSNMSYFPLHFKLDSTRVEEEGTSQLPMLQCDEPTIRANVEFCVPQLVLMPGIKEILRFKNPEHRPKRHDRLFLKNGTNRARIYNEMQGRRLRRAAATNNIEVLIDLLEKGVSPNDADPQGRTPLHVASARGYVEVVKVLLNYGADPNKTDALGNTALHLAAVTSKMPVVILLLKAGTNVLTPDRHGYNPLQLAQTKLRMLRNCKGTDMNKVKDEVHKVVQMLVAYLDRQDNVSDQIEALSSFCSKLSLSNTTDQIQHDVNDLLISIDTLSLNNN